MRPPTWAFRTADPDLERTLREQLRIRPITARVLQLRGFTCSRAAREFLEASTSGLGDPEEFPGMGRAVQRIHAARERGELVVVYGDYDVDGLSGACLLHRVLRSLGSRSEVMVPNRLKDGYGLNPTGMARVLELQPGVLITVDHGVSAVQQVAALQRAGIDVVITDHHQHPPELPQAFALLHPHCLAPGSRMANLSGSGVAFKLACALFQAASSEERRIPRVRETLRDALALAALGTIADVVPLVAENRILVRHGLERLQVTEHAGLRALRGSAGLDGRVLDTEDVSFALAPRLNAAGRMGQVDVALRLLLADSESEARTCAAQLEELNEQRKALQNRNTRRALEMAASVARHAPVLCLAGRDFHSGVIGIVAARLVEEYRKPAFVISIEEGVARGSGRSLGDFDLALALRSVSDVLRSHGGHPAAAGFEMEEARIEELQRALSDYGESVGYTTPEAVLQIDSEVHLHELDPRLCQELRRIGPFGEANPRPLFATTGAEHVEPPRRVGQDGDHLLMKLRGSPRPVAAIAFKQGHRIDEASSRDLSLAFSLRDHPFAGPSAFQLQVTDLRVGNGRS